MHVAAAQREQFISEVSSKYRSAAFKATLQRVARFARDDTAPILLQGESGTGKTTLARHAHALSTRAAGPFQHVVLSTLDDGLASSELFGHVVGAFTDARRPRAGHFASASGGTLFLDEIGKTSRALQGKLLHALEYGEIRPVGSDRDMRISARVIAATNVDLAVLVDEDVFLPDLHARLETFRIVLPPLRERRADIPLLVDESLRRHAAAAGYSGAIPSLAESVLAAFQRAEWPNNLRQLDATVHRLLLEAEGAMTITFDYCVEELAYLREEAATPLTRERVDDALSRAGSVSGAARLLGVDRTTVYRFQRRNDAAALAVAPHAIHLPSTAAPHRQQFERNQ